MVRVGIVGTGFVAHKRADAIAADGRAQLVAVTDYRWSEAVAFAHQYAAAPLDHWADLVASPDIDLVMVCHVNQDHGLVTRAALKQNKHVVVEYPLALAVGEAAAIVALARQGQGLLHVAHIELLGGSHQALKAHLPQLGPVHYARYCTLAPKRSRPNHWTYQPTLFGFPLVGALSRLHRLVDCFGPVQRVFCQNHYTQLVAEAGVGVHHQGCLCTAQLTFASGVIAEVVYGKGDSVWTSTRRLEVFGARGGLVFDGDQGALLTAEGPQEVVAGARRGLFALDTAQVLDHLLTGQPLYTSAENSLYSLRVAAAAEQSAATGQVVALTEADA